MKNFQAFKLKSSETAKIKAGTGGRGGTLTVLDTDMESVVITKG